jgi:hypothetical protein
MIIKKRSPKNKKRKKRIKCKNLMMHWRKMTS